MIREAGSILVAALAVPAAAAANPRDPEPLARSGKWVVNYDTDACHLYAQFGTDDDALVMRFTRYEPGDTFDLALYGKGLRSPQPRGEAKIDFGLKQKPVSRPATFGTAGKLPAVFLSALRLDGWEGGSAEGSRPDVTPEQEDAVKSATVRIRGVRWLRLDFGSLRQPFALMRDCTANLVRSWGYDPEVQAALLRPVRPETSPYSWFSSRDYPLAALQGGHNGMVQFRLDIDETGKVAGCHVLARTEPDDFADVTCKVLSKRAKLAPALDAGGKPVRSYYIEKVQWRAG